MYEITLKNIPSYNKVLTNEIIKMLEKKYG
jgi:hypothetical protein